ncbi:MAG: hypothetical protein QG619_1724 [Pseudomonadota bacterium]|nr:hypothetical protein [Pseudomonadota bacterium]
MLSAFLNPACSEYMSLAPLIPFGPFDSVRTLMSITITIPHIVLLVCCAILELFNTAIAGDSPKKPHQVIADLRQRMYAIGETTGRFNDFVEAERKAATDIQTYIAGGDPTALIEKNNTGQTPLMAAAFMGYSELVSELLKSDNVRKSVDDVNPKGVSAWLYANMAFRQAVWVCNPTAFKDQFTWVPLFVTQPYYMQSAENPYRRTRRLLEESGAKTGLEQAKKLWQDTCKLQDERTSTKVQESNDLLETVLAEGAEKLARFLAEQQFKKK